MKENKITNYTISISIQPLKCSLNIIRQSYKQLKATDLIDNYLPLVKK